MARELRRGDDLAVRLIKRGERPLEHARLAAARPVDRLDADALIAPRAGRYIRAALGGHLEGETSAEVGHAAQAVDPPRRPRDDARTRLIARPCRIATSKETIHSGFPVAARPGCGRY